MQRTTAYVWMLGAVAVGCVKEAEPRRPIAVDVGAVPSPPLDPSMPGQVARPSMQLSITERLACLRIGGRVACARSEQDFWTLTRAVSRSADEGAVSVTVARTAQSDIACTATGYGPVTCAGYSAGPPAFTGAIEVSAGPVHGCALRADGDVWCWGWSDIPERVPGLVAKRVVAGAAATCALTATGAVECWGAPVMGAQEPNGGPEPVRVVGLDHATDLDGNGRAFCAVQDREVLCWGHTHMLFPQRERAYVRSPVWAGVARATRVRVGAAHACALTEERIVVCWGYGSSGQLGPQVDPGKAVGPQLPSPVPALADVVDIAVGHTLTCALLESGEIRCWGSWSGAPPKDLQPRPLG